MRKLVCFILAVFFVFLASVTVGAENGSTTLSLKEADSKKVIFDVYLDTKVDVCGGEFTLSFDEDSAVYSGVDSEVFDVEAFAKDGKVNIAVATDDSVSLSKDKPAFSVKLSKKNKDSFKIKLETEYLIDDNFGKIEPEKNSTTLTIEGKAATSSKSAHKDKSEVEGKTDKSEIIGKEDDTKDTDKQRFLPIKVNGKGMSYGVLLAVGLLVVMAFLFGLVFKKYTSIEEKDN